jgi:hypothetical protein
MSRKRDKLKGFFGAKSSSPSSVLAPAAWSVGSSVTMAVLPTGRSEKEPGELDPNADQRPHEQR